MVFQAEPGFSSPDVGRLLNLLFILCRVPMLVFVYWLPWFLKLTILCRLTYECAAVEKKAEIGKCVHLSTLRVLCWRVRQGEACGLMSLFFSNSGFVKGVCFVVAGVGFRLDLRLRFWSAG